MKLFYFIKYFSDSVIMLNFFKKYANIKKYIRYWKKEKTHCWEEKVSPCLYYFEQLRSIIHSSFLPLHLQPWTIFIFFLIFWISATPGSKAKPRVSISITRNSFFPNEYIFAKCKITFISSTDQDCLQIIGHSTLKFKINTKTMMLLDGN